ncbi:hypothetical protein PGT21_010828 [Puccinia graminis f. sp. tritici]|uniref:Uncharacterized protein n=1 Tax=Puccinia graminis f. sp. tritici TaxID=56615 RepID=A0A5B0NBQ4_PUCGR|nr:hypothetical protein PGT21_010828 [Puccinia graminis f. sp. tritici]
MSSYKNSAWRQSSVKRTASIEALDRSENKERKDIPELVITSIHRFNQQCPHCWDWEGEIDWNQERDDIQHLSGLFDPGISSAIDFIEQKGSGRPDWYKRTLLNESEGQLHRLLMFVPNSGPNDTKTIPNNSRSCTRMMVKTSLNGCFTSLEEADCSNLALSMIRNKKLGGLISRNYLEEASNLSHHRLTTHCYPIMCWP